MTKITMIDSPASQVVAKALVSAQVHDSTGRAITIRRPGVLAQFRLIEALGDTAKNEVYTRMALPLIYVAEIDGDALVPITRKSELEALIQRLDEAGIEAVMAGVAENFGTTDPEKDKADLKN